MIIGVPKEIKTDEDRVALLPVGAELLIGHGHHVMIETQAGSASGFYDDQYVILDAYFGGLYLPSNKVHEDENIYNFLNYEKNSI